MYVKKMERENTLSNDNHRNTGSWLGQQRHDECAGVQYVGTRRIPIDERCHVWCTLKCEIR